MLCAARARWVTASMVEAAAAIDGGGGGGGANGHAPTTRLGEHAKLQHPRGDLLPHASMLTKIKKRAAPTGKTESTQEGGTSERTAQQFVILRIPT